MWYSVDGWIPGVVASDVVSCQESQRLPWLPDCSWDRQSIRMDDWELPLSSSI